MTRNATPKKTMPAWLTPSAGGIAVQLARTAEINGVNVDRLTLREPTVRDLRTAEKINPNDKGAEEIYLFATLAECSPADIEQLTMRNYTRVQEGYFRLLEDDEAAA